MTLERWVLGTGGVLFFAAILAVFLRHHGTTRGTLKTEPPLPGGKSEPLSSSGTRGSSGAPNAAALPGAASAERSARESLRHGHSRPALRRASRKHAPEGREGAFARRRGISKSRAIGENPGRSHGQRGERARSRGRLHGRRHRSGNSPA